MDQPASTTAPYRAVERRAGLVRSQPAEIHARRRKRRQDPSGQALVERDEPADHRRDAEDDRADERDELRPGVRDPHPGRGSRDLLGDGQRPVPRDDRRAGPAEGTHHRCRNAPRPVPIDRSDRAITAATFGRSARAGPASIAPRMQAR
jgi:hypothetical protein